MLSAIMKIPKSDKGTLLIGLTDGLNGASISYYGSVNFPEKWENHLKDALDSDFSKRLYGVLDDGGLASLVSRYVLSRFYLEGYPLPPQGKITRVTSLPAFSDALKIARLIVDMISELPYQYEAIIPAFGALKKEFCSKLSHEIRISDRLSLTSGNLIADNFKTSTDNFDIDGIFSSWDTKDPANRNIDSSSLYLTYRTSGFISDKYSPKPLADFYDDIRAFYGACAAFGMFYNFAASPKNVPAYIANHLTDSGRIFCHAQGAQTDIASASYLFTTKYTDDMLSEDNFEGFLSRVIKMFNCAERQRLKTSAIWLLRANLSNRGMDEILDATIAIEVLLGDREASDRVGLSKLMANRCAYSLGKNSDERKELYDFFIKFYRVRSDIVHSGRLKLGDDESKIVREGTKLAARIFSHEIDMS